MGKTETVVVENDVSLQDFLSSVKIASYDETKTLVPMLSDGLLEVNEEVTDAARFVSSLATLIWNVDSGSSRLDKAKIQELIARLNTIINDQVNEVIHHQSFQKLESTGEASST